MLRWLFGGKNKSGKLPSVVREQQRGALSIDTSGPEFHDLYPTEERLLSELRATASLRDFACVALTKQLLNSPTNTAGVFKAFQRTGDQLSGEEVKKLGFRANKKLGSEFVAAFMANNARQAVQKIEFAINLVFSEANKLHGLRRAEECGATEVEFRSSSDERCTDLERKLHGKVMSISEARNLTLSSGDQIVRSIFQAKVEW